MTARGPKEGDFFFCLIFRRRLGRGSSRAWPTLRGRIVDKQREARCLLSQSRSNVCRLTRRVQPYGGSARFYPPHRAFSTITPLLGQRGTETVTLVRLAKFFDHPFCFFLWPYLTSLCAAGTAFYCSLKPTVQSERRRRKKRKLVEGGNSPSWSTIYRIDPQRSDTHTSGLLAPHDIRRWRKALVLAHVALQPERSSHF
jgi:hypothetical protein